MASILIAEDEERIARFVQKGLRAAGYTTTVVEDGTGALDCASTGESDLLVLDMGLPGMDGFQVLSVLRSTGFSIPVIMCTARDSVEDTVAGLEQGRTTASRRGYDFDGSTNVVDVYGRCLRHKLGAERLVTVRGAGQRLATL